jgi:autophagy-related protein 18
VLKILFLTQKGTINCISFSKCGKYLATASDKGTLIKIYSLDNEKKIEELRRLNFNIFEFFFKGGSTSANIYSIAFSFDSKYLVCSSDSGTIHFFELNSAKNSWLGYFESANRSVSQYKGIKGSSICSFSPDDSKVVYAVSSIGEFHCVTFKNYEIPTCKSYDFLKFDPIQ